MLKTKNINAVRVFRQAAVRIALFCLAIPALAAAPDPQSVLLIVNDSTAPEEGTGGVNASLWVAQQYAAKRNVPLSNIIHIRWGAAATPAQNIVTIGWGDFVTQIRNPIRAFLAQPSVKGKIKYIVPTYGVPFRTNSPTTDPWGVPGTSVDSFLAEMELASPDQAYRNNPVYSTTNSVWTVPATGRVYPVIRLDGPSAVVAASLVDRALTAEQGILRSSGTGYFDFQNRLNLSDTYRPADQTMLNGYKLCLQYGMTCAINNQSLSGGRIAEAPSTLWAWGWYFGPNDAYSFAPGAVGAQLTSYTATNIRKDGDWVPHWLLRGITATWGATSEPYTTGYANGDTLLRHLFNGATFGEAAYLANPYLGWAMIFVGDPLFRPLFLDAPVAGPTFSGQIAGSAGPVRDVSVLITGPGMNQTVNTGTLGNFTARGLKPGSVYTATPLKLGYAFDPAIIPFTASGDSNEIGYFKAVAIVKVPPPPPPPEQQQPPPEQQQKQILTDLVTGITQSRTRNNFGGWVGLQLTVNDDPLNVTALGRLCLQGNSGTHTVRLVDAGTGVDVPGGSVSVNMAGCVDGQFVHAKLTDTLVLPAGSSYHLVSQEKIGGDVWYDVGPVESTAAATMNGAVYQYDGAPNWIKIGSTPASYVTPSLQYFIDSESPSKQPASETSVPFVTSASGTYLRNNFSGWVGMRLRVGDAPIPVTSVGRFCAPGNTGTHTVKFVDGITGVDVPGGSAAVPMAGCIPGQFVFANLPSPMTLPAGSVYFLVTQEFSGGDRWYDIAGVTTQKTAAVISAVYYGAGWIFPGGTNLSYVPPNFK